MSLFRNFFNKNNKTKPTKMEREQIKPEQEIVINGVKMIIMEVHGDETVLCKEVGSEAEEFYDIDTLMDIAEMPTEAKAADSNLESETVKCADDEFESTPAKEIEQFQPTFPGANILFYPNQKFLEDFKDSVGETKHFPAGVNGVPSPGQTLLNITVYAGSDKVDLKGVPHISAIDNRETESFWVKNAL